MKLSSIHHIAIIVSDIEKAREFYVQKLGFEVIRENYRAERGDWKLDLRVDEHTELEIFAEKNSPQRVNRPEACGLRHLAFRVESVEETVKELKSLGITIYFEKENIDTANMTDEMMITIMGGLAQEESVSISKNIKWSYQKRFEKGIVNVFSAPFGFKLIISY